MQPTSRHEAILALVARSGEASVDALAREIGVSHETVRRDLARLDAAGRLRRFHGGARAVGAPVAVPAAVTEKEWPFAQRMAQNAAGKARIATAASAFFQPDDSLFIDTGSTTVAFAEALAGRPPLVVITNAPRIAATLAGHGHKVFLIGGAYGADAGESLGPLALEQIGKFRARHAVLTVGAIDQTCMMDFDLQEAEVAKAMIERADRVTVLADHSKFDRRAVFEVAPLAAIHTLVTDRAPSEPMGRALAVAGVELVVVESA